MSWLTLAVRAEASYAVPLSDALLAHGALSVDMLDADADTPDEQAIFGEPGEPTSAVWQHNLVNALFESEADVAAILASCCTELGITPIPEHRIESLEESDWVRLTQAQFDPIRISDRLWIVPTWHEPADPAAINIVLDPGLAFGTGSHPTTRLCLRWLDEHIKGGESVLDYGCGSGILAIAALKLGAASAIGVDVDAQAVQASHDNAVANQVAAEFYLPEAVTLAQYDVVVANILTNPLRALAPLLAAAARPGGRIVLSGILAEQADEVMRIYSQWFDLAPAVLEDGWCCLSGVKKTDAITQCPECGTRFKVTDAQLEAHEGMVRCGRCHGVFNAREHLYNDEPSPQLSLPIEPEPQSEEVPAEIAPEAGSEQIDTPSGSVETELPPTPDASGVDAATELLPEQDQFAEESPEEIPASRPRKRRWPGILALLLLTLVLVGQTVYFFRIELAAHLPGLKPLLAQYCALLDCTVELPREAELMSIESSELESDRVQSNIITLRALLHNRAQFAQAYPNLELSLTDLQDHVVARRVFKPTDYLMSASEIAKGFAANRELEIALRMDTTDLKPAGYRLFLFYPQ